MSSLKYIPWYSTFIFTNKVLLGEIDEDKESQSALKEVSLEEILEAQSKHQAEKEERDRLRAKAFKERGLSYTIEDKEDMY